MICQGWAEHGHDRRQLSEHVSGQRLVDGRRPTIRKGLGQGHVSQRAAIADIHAAKREIPIGTLKENRDALACERMKGVGNDE
jgi:hypothetical protein